MTSVADKPLIEVRGLDVRFSGRDGAIAAVSGVGYAIGAERTLGVVGESGCGKSVTALAVMGLIDPPGQVTGEAILLEGTDLLALSETEMEAVRGARVSMIFQEPMTALNPVFTIGDQIGEAFTTHRALGRREARAAAIDMLDQVGIAAPAARIDDYPHQLSGGMRQRVMIAMALACRPALLIADEPTTALDVTVQAQILELMLEIQGSLGMAIQFISHDLGVISEIADDIAVMYAGRIVERAPAPSIFEAPAHPYTQGLLETVPRIGGRRDMLPAIPGNVPDPARLPSGCAFRDRCARATALCAANPPALETVASDHWAACIRVGH